MSFPRFSLSSFVTLFSFQGTIFILILNSNKFACSSLFLRRRRVHRYARLRKNAKCAWNCLNWWRWGESNSWPPACKAGALPAELHPQILVDTSLLTNITSLVIFRMFSNTPTYGWHHIRLCASLLRQLCCLSLRFASRFHTGTLIRCFALLRNASGGPKWTRTTDLTLIRRAL